MKDNVRTIVLPIILIVAGLLSPSNGVDECYDKSPTELLLTALGIMLAAALFYLVLRNVKFWNISDSKTDK